MSNDIGAFLIIVGTAIVSLVGWGLKEVIKSLIVKLVQTMAKMEMLDRKFESFNHAANEVPRLRSDVNEHHAQIKKINEALNSQGRG